MASKRPSPNIRALVRERARHRCEYCLSLEAYSTGGFSVEHIVPIYLGGETILNNLALSCQTCNNHKYTKVEFADPLSGERFPLYNPRQDIWHEHFAWHLERHLLLGVSAIGRATIVGLHLNRDEVINLRRLLAMIGHFPPPAF